MLHLDLAYPIDGGSNISNLQFLLEIKSESDLTKFLQSPHARFLAVRLTRLQELPANLGLCLRVEAELSGHLLFEKSGKGCVENADSGKDPKLQD